MFRRRRTTRPASDRPASAATAVAPLPDGWVLPRGLGGSRPAERPSPVPFTLVGTTSSPTATPVDPAGLVVREGWSLDWWIGADDRWHVPAREAAVRQAVMGDAPVVETMLRVPGGDAVHRAYGLRSPRRTGDEWVVAEVQNATPVPFAVALVVRPFVADGRGDVGAITVEPVEGGRGRDVAHLVRVDGRPALVLPRRPSKVAAGSAAAGDALDAVLAGEAGDELVEARCDQGMATLALVLPLPHTAVLRALLPVGELDDAEAVAYPSVAPEAATVASGWDLHRRSPRIEVPEHRVRVALDRARAQLQLAHDGAAVRRDGAHAPDIEPDATAVLLGALDVLDQPTEVGPVVAGWQGRLAEASPAFDITALGTVARHWLLHRVDALRDWMLPEVAAAVERLDRADRRGLLADPSERWRAGDALELAAQMLQASGQPEAAGAVRELGQRLRPGGAPGEPPGAEVDAFARLVAVPRLVRQRDPQAVALLDEVVAAASPTGAWPGPTGSRLGHDLAAAGALVLAVRSLLLHDEPGAIAVLPVFPPGWYGAGVEVHDAPTAAGRLSYAVRWHGTRPALLWEIEPHEGSEHVVLTAPGLDASWSSTELRGEALLGEVAPPEGLETITFVPEHPDIDPDMRRPGADPEPPAAPLPEGGSFS